ncbi:MAG: hypothetical protein ABEJ31_01905 [Haloarculaceae archaeon]
MALREVLAAVLGIGFGAFVLAFPEFVVRVQTVGRVPGQRRGPYGQDGAPPAWALWLVRALGAVAVLVGLYIGSQQVGVL